MSEPGDGVRDDGLRDIFREAGRRLTSQRRLILDVVKACDEHLEAEAIHDQARRQAPDLNLATVYRTLALLKEMGLVEEHRLGEGHRHYEAVQERPHYHFTCRHCGRVIEFDSPLVAAVKRDLCEKEGVEISRSHLHFIGCCKDCQG